MNKKDKTWLRMKAHAHLRAALICLQNGGDLRFTDPDLGVRLSLVYCELEQTSQELRIRNSDDKDQEPEKLTRACPKDCNSEIWARWRFLIPREVPDIVAKRTAEKFHSLYLEIQKDGKRISEIKQHNVVVGVAKSAKRVKK